MKWLLALFAASFSIPLAAQQPVRPTNLAALHYVGPWEEAMVSVTDISAATRLFREIGAWRTTYRGRVSREELNYWRLPPTASARFELLCPPTGGGCLRFVQFRGVPQRPIRLAARAWDTGGIFSIMVRSDNVQDVFERAIAMGWWAESEPIRFRFGQSDLSNVVLTGPHGINLALYQRHSPAFTAFPVGRISQAFNSMRMVRDRAASRRFYEQGLGFGVLFDSANEPAEPAFSNFGIPYNLTPTVRRAAAALQPFPGETGRVEVMQIEGFTGRDFAEYAVPPNLGIISVRYPVGGELSEYAASLRANGIQPIWSWVYGGELIRIAVRDPDGSITEFQQERDILVSANQRTRP
jgi:catechol 2,3-dioxygenase-like lactoylglutathione lyase family enzyme